MFIACCLSRKFWYIIAIENRSGKQDLAFRQCHPQMPDGNWMVDRGDCSRIDKIVTSLIIRSSSTFYPKTIKELNPVMPIYEYISWNPEEGCWFCKRIFETIQGIREPPLCFCPECGRPVYAQSAQQIVEQIARAGDSDGLADAVQRFVTPLAEACRKAQRLRAPRPRPHPKRPTDHAD